MALPGTTVYFATNRNPSGAYFGADLASPDAAQTVFGAVAVTDTDLANASSGTMGPVTDRSIGTFGTATLNAIAMPVWSTTIPAPPSTPGISTTACRAP
ncbi:MAG: hypothetical protein ACREHE_01280 [Rhizomicrobium sp.]